jgi:hypothetical protein
MDKHKQRTLMETPSACDRKHGDRVMFAVSRPQKYGLFINLSAIVRDMKKLEHIIVSCRPLMSVLYGVLRDGKGT